MNDANLSAPDEDPTDYDTCAKPPAGCGKRKPNEDFRPRSGICKACEKREARQDKQMADAAAATKIAIAEAGRRFLEAERRKELNLPAVSQIATALLAEFGGENNVQSFAHAWYGQVLEACENSPGSKGTLDAFRHIAALVSVANAQEVVRDIPNLDDAELAALIGQVAVRANKGIIEVKAKRIESDE